MHSENVPKAASIIARRQDAPTIFTFDLKFEDKTEQDAFAFNPGQFNMLYLFGVGEVAISIASDPLEKAYISHTIRVVGRVTRALEKLSEGQQLGVRGPYGRGWPMDEAIGKDVVIITGGLGCAPVLSAINYILARREQFGSLSILQGVKHSDDFIFREQYARWQKIPRTKVYVAADKAGPKWPFAVGYVTDMIQSLNLNPGNTIAMMCGPEGMMHTAVKSLTACEVPEESIYLSMERNMACGIGHCGHCQYGDLFICKDGPVLAYPKVKALFSEQGF